MTITEFLLARIEEDEHTARQGDHRDVGNDIGWWSMSEGDVLHIGTDRVLVECAVKRRIVEELVLPYIAERRRLMGGQPGWDDEHPDLLRLLALPYADHPDYDAAWAV